MKFLLLLTLTVFSGVESYAAKAVSDTVPYSAQSMAGDFSTAALQMGVNDRTSFQAVWTESTPSLSGTLKIQVSSDCSNWDDLSGMSVDLTDGSGSQLFILNAVSFKCLRFNFVSTGGDCALTVNQRAVNQ
mgnify:CR=1 FL=1